MSSAFYENLDALPGAGGAWLRGDGPRPAGVVWLPHPCSSRQTLQRRVAVALGAAVAMGAALLLPAPFNALCFVVAVAAAALAREWGWRWRSRPRGPGRHGLLLADDHLLYRVEDTAAYILRADITGVERRVHPVHHVVGAFTLRVHTGRGALPSPAPGPEALDKMLSWWREPLRVPTQAAPSLTGCEPAAT